MAQGSQKGEERNKDKHLLFPGVSVYTYDNLSTTLYGIHGKGKYWLGIFCLTIVEAKEYWIAQYYFLR